MTESAAPPLDFAPAKPRRALALDALRGFAILTMVLSGVVPEGILPAWMYHAQVPPPKHVFDPGVPGMTWVDLVFPFFLFSMGAAFPLALSRRLKKGPLWKVLLGIVERGFLLGTFGIFLDHIRPYAINGSPTNATWLLALLGFGLLFAMYARLPEAWPAAARWGVKLAGWGGAVLFLYLVWNSPDHMFDPERRDIIIIILTNVAVFGSLAWLVSRGNWMLRLAIMGGLVAMRLAASEPGWVGKVWNATLVPHVIQVGIIGYLLIALPGAICGDLLLKWIQAPPEEHTKLGNWSVGRLWGIAGLMMGFLIVCLVGLQARWLFPTALVCFALGFLGWWMLSNPGNENERFLKSLFQWGIAWLVIGLLFEPYEGGIKKDPATFSYFFVTAGLAVFLLMAFIIVIDIRRHEKWVGLLVANGQNPMIAYVTNGNLLMPLMNLTMLGGVIDRMTPGPWLGTLRGLFVTFLVALIVWGFTKRKIFWRT